jgi:hypothetical protein
LRGNPSSPHDGPSLMAAAAGCNSLWVGQSWINQILHGHRWIVPSARCLWAAEWHSTTENAAYDEILLLRKGCRFTTSPSEAIIMNPTLVKDRTHCPKGHDLRIHGYYFGTNQRCGACNRRRAPDRNSTPAELVLESQTVGIRAAALLTY